MRCKNCKRQITENSLFCNWCGQKQIKFANEVSVPKPRQLKDGRWFAQIMISGERVLVYGNTEEEYRANAKLVKEGSLIPQKKIITLNDIEEKYIQANINVLSPSTIRGYKMIQKHRFKDYSDADVKEIDWQEMINNEVHECSPKTLKNAWGFILPALNYSKIPVQNVNLPKVSPKELGWLDYNQIRILLNSCKDSRIEMSILLALHSIRLSEILALTAEDIYDNAIHVSKSSVVSYDGYRITKNVNKTEKSTRTIPFLIPRIQEIIPKNGKLCDYSGNAVCRAIDTACRKAGVPEVGTHGLRRSFASLGYHLGWGERTTMLLGGWSNMQTVHKIYIKLSKDDIALDVQKMRQYYEFTNEES